MLNHELEYPLKSLNLNQKVLDVKKGTTLQLEGNKNIKFYYVTSGLLRSFIIDDKGKEHTYMFAPENWLIGDSMAFSNNSESQLNIEALEDSKVISFDPLLVNKKDSLTAAEYTTEIYRLLKRIGVLQERVLMQMGASALVRYDHFTKTYPQILERVPLKMIATYLGITPEALSNVRREWGKKK